MAATKLSFDHWFSALDRHCPKLCCLLSAPRWQLVLAETLAAINNWNLPSLVFHQQ